MVFIHVPYNQPERAREILAIAASFGGDKLTGLSVFVNNHPPRSKITIEIGYRDERVFKWIISFTGVTIDFTDITKKLIQETQKGKYNAHIGTAGPESIEKLHFYYMTGDKL